MPTNTLKDEIRKLYGVKKSHYINFEPRLEQLMQLFATEQRQLVDRFKDELTKIHHEELTYGSVMKAMETALLNKIRKEL